MIPAYARPAHRRLREKLARILEWNEAEGPNREIDGDRSLGIITSGISFMHAREAAPEAAVLKLGMTYPLPLETIRRFVGSVSRCVVIEEGDPYLLEAIRAAGLQGGRETGAVSLWRIERGSRQAHSGRRTLRRSRYRRRESRRNCARVALTVRSSVPCATWIASWPVT